MSKSNVTEGNCVSFFWRIKNFRFFSADQMIIESPIFIADTLETTKWRLQLWPSRSGDFQLYLQRQSPDCGPEKIAVSFELSFLAADLSVLYPILYHAKETFYCYNQSDFKTNIHGDDDFIESSQVLKDEMSIFLPNDTLTVCCRIWKDRDLAKSEQVPEKRFGTTHIDAKQYFLKAKLLDFNSFKSSGFQTIDMSEAVGKNPIVSSSLFIESPESQGKIHLHVHPDTQTINRDSFCDIFLLDCEKNKIKCASGDGNVFTGYGNQTWMWKLVLPFSLEDLMNEMASYLYDGSLHFLFVITTTGKVSRQEINTADFKAYPPEALSNFPVNSKLFEQAEKLNQSKEVPKRNKAKEDFIPPGTLGSDFKCMLTEKLFCDATLRGKSQSFPAHKIVLCARSPVFKTMFSAEMKESLDGSIDCLDLDDDTVQHLLHYLYTDCLDELDFEQAKALYYAADKYEVMTLRSKCSDFLKDNITEKNVLNVLVLADTHHDADLKVVTHEFIFKIYKRFIVSDDWKNFMESHVKLAADVMLQKSLR